jgi:hypothetical protein
MQKILKKIPLFLVLLMSVGALLAKPVCSEEVEISFAKSGKRGSRDTKPAPILQSTVYKKATVRGLEIKMLPGESETTKGTWLESIFSGKDNAFLRINKKGGLHNINRSYKLGDINRKGGGLPVVKELEGLPGIVTNLEKYYPYNIRFHLSKPARVYAYINWTLSQHDNPEMKLWKAFKKDPSADFSVYYRDFPAGDNVIKFIADPFIGVGISPLDSLSTAEKIVVTGVTENGKMILNIRNEHKSSQKLVINYSIKDPSVKKAVSRGKLEVMVKTGDNKINIPVKNTKEGTMYFVETSIKGAGSEWKRNTPYGRFPVPKKDASVSEPIFPYGAYIKLSCSADPDIYNLMLSATCYHFRKMGMNTAVFAGKGAPVDQLDIMHKYHLKAIVRLGSMHGRINYVKPGSMKHPAILTYMVGDEPKIGPKLDSHIKMFKNLTEKYPQFKPISCTIYDGYGTGSIDDPDRIYNDYLNKFKLIRFGRLYCFQKLEFGVGNPIAYKPRQEATSIMLGLEADAKREWWIAPQFFGLYTKEKPMAYWRVPTGLELSSFMHLAVAHRCTGLLGWGTHSHGNCHGVCFDGKTMAITFPETYKELALFGKQLMKIKPILQNFTTSLVQVQRVEPFAVDVQARWLKSGQIAAYTTNRDLKKKADVELLVFLGHERMKKFGSPKLFFKEIDKVVDALTGRKVSWKKVWKDKCGFLKITDKLKPGRSALYIIYGKGKNGKFSRKAVPPGARSHLVDKAYIPFD